MMMWRKAEPTLVRPAALRRLGRTSTTTPSPRWRERALVSTANSFNFQDATDVIKFYGHSLGRADYSYFQSIFDGVDLYESDTTLVFYFPLDTSDEAEAINNKWRAQLSNDINNLLTAYGATMDNKEHGKNLMHKLLLEGRLIIRGLQVD